MQNSVLRRETEPETGFEAEQVLASAICPVGKKLNQGLFSFFTLFCFPVINLSLKESCLGTCLDCEPINLSLCLFLQTGFEPLIQGLI